VKILTTQHYPTIPRTVIRVVENPNDPRWVHVDTAGVATAAPRTHTGNTDKSGTICKLCRFNHRIQEFTFTRGELDVALNKWGNPAHDNQPIATTRPRTWDELYQEVDARLRVHAEYDTAPRKAPPSLTPELEPDFELIPTGEPYMLGDTAHQRIKVLRYGQARKIVNVSGNTPAAFAEDKAEGYRMAQEQILAEEEAQTAAARIATGSS